VAAMVGLISAQRQAEMMQRAMSAFYSEFNRIAADELPRTDR
jgi:flagellar basal body rod protein FlgG